MSTRKRKRDTPPGGEGETRGEGETWTVHRGPWTTPTPSEGEGAEDQAHSPAVRSGPLGNLPTRASDQAIAEALRESGPPRITLHVSGSSDEGDEFDEGELSEIEFEESEFDEESGTDEESEEGEAFSLFRVFRDGESLRERGERWRRAREAWLARDPEERRSVELRIQGRILSTIWRDLRVGRAGAIKFLAQYVVRMLHYTGADPQVFIAEFARIERELGAHRVG